MARQVKELGVRPELEVFDTGHLVQVHELIREGLIDDPVLIQLCMGIAYGAPDDPATLLALVNQLPPPAPCSPRSRSAACSCPTSPWPCCRWQRARRARGQPLARAGELATNAELVERAVRSSRR